MDYKVDIRRQAIGALVYVELKLQRDHQVSLEAFEEASHSFLQGK